MKSALLAAPRQFEIADVDVPQPAAGEALVRVRSVGVCGSDLHFYRGEFPLPAGFCLGHEVSGEVEALGEGVSGFAKGDPVALELFTVCRTCPQCRSGNYHLCRQRKSNGIDMPGGLREYMTVPAYDLYKLPDGVDCELGSLVEPLAVSVHGLKISGMQYGERVAVLGAGTIGLMSIAAAKAMGASHIAVSARHPHQRAMAEALGADIVFDATPEGAQQMARSAGAADIVVETVGGSADTLAQALTLVAPRGRVCMLGVFTAPVQLHPLLLTLREATIVGSNCYNRAGAQSDYEIAIEIMRRQGQHLRSMITHRFPLEGVADAYATADDKRSGAIKVMVSPG